METENKNTGRTARAVPKVAVRSRHVDGCKNKRDDCACPKQLQWFDGKLCRVSAGTNDFLEAQKMAVEKMAEFEAANRGEIPAPKPTTPERSARTLSAAVEKFLATKASSEVTDKHVAKLKFEMGAFADFTAARGLLNLADITTEDCLDYRNSLKGAQNTRAKKVYRLIGFFEFCVEMGWLARNPARAQSVIIDYADQQTPKALTDAQFSQLLAAIPKVNGRTTDEQRAALRSMVTLMRWSGLAVRDACTMERGRFEKNGDGFYKFFLRRAKTGHSVYSTLTAEIVEQIFAGAKAEGKYLFVDSVPTGERELDNMVKGWGVLFVKLGEAADLKDDHGQPYRFTSHSLRHTFVLWALNAGLPTEDVAALLGDTVEIVAKHYSEWITARQERLNERMMTALTASARK